MEKLMHPKSSNETSIKISVSLLKLWEDPEASAEFIRAVSMLLDLDVSMLKKNFFERQAAHFMGHYHIKNLKEFYETLKNDSKKQRELIGMLTINIGGFFKNKDRFEELEKEYLPELAAKNKLLKVWSAGCSNGAEIYSIAMIFAQNGWLDQSILLASDFDKRILQNAQEAIFCDEDIRSLTPGYERFFSKIGHNKNKIVKSMIDKVKFIQQDLFNSEFEKDFDLIMCRDVVINYTEEARYLLYKKFYEALTMGGILFIGATERVQNYKKIGYGMKAPFFYYKP